VGASASLEIHLLPATTGTFIGVGIIEELGKGAVLLAVAFHVPHGEPRQLDQSRPRALLSHHVDGPARRRVVCERPERLAPRDEAVGPDARRHHRTPWDQTYDWSILFAEAVAAARLAAPLAERADMVGRGGDRGPGRRRNVSLGRRGGIIRMG
jgi:hypothetical protein